MLRICKNVTRPLANVMLVLFYNSRTDRPRMYLSRFVIKNRGFINVLLLVRILLLVVHPLQLGFDSAIHRLRHASQISLLGCTLYSSKNIPSSHDTICVPHGSYLKRRFLQFVHFFSIVIFLSRSVLFRKTDHRTHVDDFRDRTQMMGTVQSLSSRRTSACP